MKGNQKARIIELILILFIFLFAQFAASGAEAAFTVQGSTNGNPIDAITGFFMRLPPVPFANFMIGGKQVEQNALNVMPHMDLNALDPRTLFGKLDSWFYGITTFHLAQIAKPLGNLIADLFAFFANLIRQAVAKL